MLQYILLSNLPCHNIPLHSMTHLSLNQYQMHSHHYARHLPQRSYTLCHLPIKPIIIHILISISYSAGPNTV
ncbi:BFP_1a_G0034160.mRNA.1.CDS.1 [Saccharomyces cerevisiae]|nr:BFP_1a_G0004870.mRNA.1.CDS.1 [Saccharomyces cerevisiae]CAI4599820.1 BFP_1a_G0034160.mRNA.1.CDS.1 [Saccharomyces cerevisiae]CAI7052047.1 BFP_1a_G0004870.mRNA.1.CDS.1 [Saccharomyces cerevisiae]CAI7216329.1 BFP_1a_G0034160.mRNA.1.CDS.1 [Saccharomyces cerevisiae]